MFLLIPIKLWVGRILKTFPGDSHRARKPKSSFSIDEALEKTKKRGHRRAERKRKQKQIRSESNRKPGGGGA